MKITAAVLDEIGAVGPYAETRPLRLAELELRAPRAGELLVRIDAAGLCHSDLSVVNGDRPRPTPMALGHEAAATVLEAADPDGGFAPGDKVVLAFLPACGQCADCGSGRGFLCAPGAAANGAGRLLRGGHRLVEGDHDVFHHLGVSAFATHAVIDQRSAVKIPADIPPEIAALFGCAVLTGVGAVLNTAATRPGESVAVYGLGGVGLASLLGALVAGASPAAAVHPSDAEAAIAELTGTGVDVAIETAGKAVVLEAAYKATRRGGRTVSVGLPNPAERLSLSPVSLVGEGKTLMGSYMGSSIPARDIPRYIALWRAGRLPVDRLLTSVSPLSEINTLLDALAGGQAIRQIVIP
jgi:alcohol dehydrogenase